MPSSAGVGAGQSGQARNNLQQGDFLQSKLTAFAAAEQVWKKNGEPTDIAGNTEEDEEEDFCCLE